MGTASRKARAVSHLRPGAELACSVRLSDPAGAPLADAAVTLAAVDEGILRPAAFRTPDPFAYFCAKRAHEVGVDAMLVVTPYDKSSIGTIEKAMPKLRIAAEASWTSSSSCLVHKRIRARP